MKPTKKEAAPKGTAGRSKVLLRGKDKPLTGQTLELFNYLFLNTVTATQAALALNIQRPNICRCKRSLEKAGKLWQVKRGICPITKYPAWLLSTNPNYSTDKAGGLYG